MTRDPASGSSRLPWDVAVVSWLLLAMALLDAPAMLGLAAVGMPHAIRDRDPLQWGAMAMVAIRFTITMIAAYQLRALRPWARWWLVLDSLLGAATFAVDPPDGDEIRLHWQQWIVGGYKAFDAVHWAARYCVPLGTLLVLARSRDDFGELGTRERALVGIGIGVLACALVSLAHLEARALQEMMAARARESMAPRAPDGSHAVRADGIVTLRPMFRGRPLGDVPSELVTVKLHGHVIPNDQPTAFGPDGVLQRPWRVRHGRIKVLRVPVGQYGAVVTVNRPTVSSDGDLRGYKTLRTKTGAEHVSIPLAEVMRLTRPSQDGVATVTSPVEIAWEPIPGTSRYEAALVPDDDSSMQDDTVYPHAVLSAPRWRVSAPPGAWGIHLSAFGKRDELLGELVRQPILVVATPTH